MAHYSLQETGRADARPCEPCGESTPPVTAPDRFADGPRERPIDLVLENTRATIPRAQAAAAQRQLVKAGIELRRMALADGAYPPDLSSIPEAVRPDPFTGRPLSYSVAPDGSATLALVGADELLEQVVVASAASVPPISLPAP